VLVVLIAETLACVNLSLMLNLWHWCGTRDRRQCKLYHSYSKHCDVDKVSRQCVIIIMLAQKRQQ